MHPPVKHCYEFGPFRVDADKRLLYRDGEVVPLTARVFDVLLVLITNGGRTLTKEELMEQVWPGNFVEEGNLTRNVSTLRKALGESPDDHHYLVTIPGRGYRFVAEVREAMDEERPNLRSNVMGNGVGESIEAAAAAIDRAALLDGEAIAAADHKMKRPRLLTSPLALALAAFVILLVAGGGLVGWYFRRESAPPVSSAAPLTSYPGFEHNPALSPDGNQVAFSWNGESQDNFDIYIKLIGSGRPLRLTTNPAGDISPAWSRDGGSIAFLRRQGGDRNELMLIPALGGTERKLTETFIVDFRGESRSRLPSLAWSPDGRWIAVSHREAGDLGEGLFLVSAQTGEKRRLTRLPAGSSGDFMPAFSPDGRTLLFARFSGFLSVKAHLLSLSEDFEPVGEARPLKTDERFVRSPVWTPDGRYVLYLAAPNIGQREHTELRKIAASGAGLSERVSLLEGNIHEVSLGRHLVYARSDTDADIWRAEITPAGGKAREPRRLISSTRLDNRPRYSLDGKKISFTSGRSGAEEIWIA